MGILDFIFGIIVLITISFLIIGGIATIWDTKELEQENEELKVKMEKLRKNGGNKNAKKTK